ncbi:MAG: DUF1232 domain-containing protein [Eubacterium sp.]|nr:DUF1232 domain-containing protein [Eubacterium sp.]
MSEKKDKQLADSVKKAEKLNASLPESLKAGKKGLIIRGVLVALAVAYAVFPADIVNDAIPIAGYADDIVAILATVIPFAVKVRDNRRLKKALSEQNEEQS